MHYLSVLVIPSVLCLGSVVAEEMPIQPEASQQDESTPPQTQAQDQPKILRKNVSISALEPFTGSVSGARVRMRLQPTLDSVVLKECSPHDLVQVVGEVDDFYAILPESNQKAYIFRTYVLDGAVEGSNVNIRLKPDTSSPVIVQAQQGDKISGRACKDNPKWLEIEMPAAVRFYVAKEFVTKEGPLSLFADRTQQRKELLAKIQSLDVAIKVEFAKLFNDIDPSRIKKELEAIQEEAKTSMTDISKKASWLLHRIEQEYLRAKVALQSETLPVTTPITEAPKVEQPAPKTPSISFSLKEQEQNYIQSKIDAKEINSAEELYTLEQKNPVLLKGKIIPFERTVKMKPGDFVLIHPVTKVPVAYLYSTQVDLGSLVGTMVAIEAGGRPNHDFALPAYFVYVVTPIQK